MPVHSPIRFAHHSLAVLSAAIAGATLVSVIFTIGLAIEAIPRPPSAAWLATMAIVIWFGVFMIALPGAAIILSMLWPVTRRRTPASMVLCLLAGAAGGIILAPIASKGMGASAKQILFFAVIGVVISLMYRIVAVRLGRHDTVVMVRAS